MVRVCVPLQSAFCEFRGAIWLFASRFAVSEWGEALQFRNVPGRECEMLKCCVNVGEIVTSGRSEGLAGHQRSLPAQTVL